MANFTTTTPTTSDPADIYGLLGVGTDNEGKLLDPDALALGATNLSYTASPTQGVVVSDTGNDATIPAAGTNAGLFLPAEKTKLEGIEPGAEVNNISDVNVTDLTDGGDTTLHIHDSRYYTETEIDTLLSGKQDESVIVSSNQTAVNDGYYVNVATATYTDPSPVEGKGFVVFVRNGTATIGGTAYSTAGNIIYRFFHSGGWSNYVTGATNLSYTASPTQGVVVSDTGNDATIPAADGTNAGLFLPAEKTKLAGIAAGAEVNVNADWNAVSGDAQILNKPTLITDHTGLSNIGTNTHAQIDTHIGSTLNPHSVTKAQVGLDQVDNTSDLNKPVSTAVSTALGNKQNTLVSGTNIKTINNTSLLGSGDIAIFTSPEIITTPTGIIYRFTQPTKPTQRAPGVPLGIGDRWYNTTHGVDTVWNGTYWVGRVRDLGHLGADSIYSTINNNYLFNLPTVMGEPTSGKYLISYLFRSATPHFYGYVAHDASNHFRFTQGINDAGGIAGGEFYSYDPYVNGYIGIRDVYYDFFARPCWFINQNITKVGNPSTLSYNYNGIIIKEVY